MIDQYVNKVIHGNCVDVMCNFPDNSIPIVLTSPPYDSLRDYKGYKFDFEAIAKQLYRVTKQGGVVVWVVGDQTVKGSETGTSFRQALYFKEIGFNLETMIWEKPTFTATGSLRVRYASVFEFMFVLTKGKVKTFNPIIDRICKSAGGKKVGTVRKTDGTLKRKSSEGKVQRELGQRFNIWKIPTQTQIGHPAPFPEQLAADHIRSWSNEGDIVLDPMAGSGTTLKAARKLRRKYIGIEISEEYVAICEERLSQQVLEFN
jgi:DNA modification methylase